MLQSVPQCRPENFALFIVFEDNVQGEKKEKEVYDWKKEK